MGTQLWIKAMMVGGMVITITGCDVARETFGYTKQAPDEFQVVRRAPLTLPPDYTLRVPEPGISRPQETSATAQAYQALTGTRSEGGANQTIDLESNSPGEAAFLREAGAEFANPNIRSVVDRETTVFIQENTTFLDQLIFWRDNNSEAVEVDPAAETRRIQDNQALGLPVTEGDTPIINRREQGILEGIF